MLDAVRAEYLFRYGDESDAADAESRITPRTKAILAVHMLGNPADLEALGTYSFNIFKTINAGDGGMVVTDDEDLYTKAFAFHDQGHLPNPAYGFSPG